jgi:Ca2+-transporting ATPase
MPLLTTAPSSGLTDEAVATARAAHGRNKLTTKPHSGVLVTMREVVTEPMFLLLLAACTVYIALGEGAEAITLGVALPAVAGISVYQQIRSDRTLGALRKLT